MPIHILGTLLVEGTDGIPGWPYIKTYAPPILTAMALKLYFGGASNTWDRDLHGKVYLVTGATSGLGRATVTELAKRGAQLILLTAQSTEENPWLIEYIDDLRDKTENITVYSEKCDLNSLYSIRKFATKWLDNSPPRRLDGVICFAGESLPSGYDRQGSEDGVEKHMAINYLGHYHLLTLMSPALRVQPADRDVAILLTTCNSQALGQIDLKDPLWVDKKYPSRQPWKVFGSSKLMLSMFGLEFQKRLEAVPRKDGAPSNVRVNMVNPGFMRSPSTRRVLSFGSLIGLFIYLIMYPIWFIFLKTCEQGAQSFVHVISNPMYQGIRGGNFINNCTMYNPSRKELHDEEMLKELFDKTEEEIARLEKASAIERNKLKKEKQSTSAAEEDNENELRKDTVPLFPNGQQSTASSTGAAPATTTASKSNSTNKKKKSANKKRKA